MNLETKRKLNLLGLNEFTLAIETQEMNLTTYVTMTFDERLDLVVDSVYQQKYNEKIKRRIKQAKLRYDNASLDIIDYSSRNLNPSFIKELGALHFIDTSTNIIIQGFTGSGKTFLGCSIAKAACQRDIKTFYIRMPDLIQLKDEEKSIGKMKRLINKLSTYKLLVIDEWLLNSLNDEDVLFLLEIFERRYNNSSTIFITQFKTNDWHARLGGGVQADAIMDRLVHNAITIESGNVNMRERIDSKKVQN